MTTKRSDKTDTPEPEAPAAEELVDVILNRACRDVRDADALELDGHLVSKADGGKVPASCVDRRGTDGLPLVTPA